MQWEKAWPKEVAVGRCWGAEPASGKHSRRGDGWDGFGEALSTWLWRGAGKLTGMEVGVSDGEHIVSTREGSSPATNYVLDTDINEP